MKKKIAILGSTGSIGKTTIDILKKDKKNFNIILLTTNKNTKELLKQINIFKVKYVVVTDFISYLRLKKIISKNIKVFSNINQAIDDIKTKFDLTISSISGLDGLYPTLKIIKKSKKIAIANKEAIICGWNLIQKKLKQYKTEFIPVDSEHFSIWSLINNKTSNKNIENIFITASGGPFLNLPLKKMKNILPKQALKHPNWSMGNKISIDSATLMNKVFEVIETQKIFKIKIQNIKILIHNKSYVHSMIEFKNGLIKILAHEPNMKIPIFNIIYDNNKSLKNNNKVNLDFLNNLNFKKVNESKFPVVKILNMVSSKNTLFETIIVSINDELVSLFLNKKIKYHQISSILLKMLNLKEFISYKKKKPNNIREIYNLSEYVRLKTRSYCI